MINELTINNKTMKYLKMGSGNRAMVMVPGLSIKSVMEYENNIVNDYKMFLKDFTIYCFNPIDNPPTNYSINEMAEDLFNFIKELKLNDIYLFGASHGGMISLLLTLKHSEIIKRIVIASSTPVVSNDEFELINSWIKLAKEKDCESLYKSFSKVVYPDKIYKRFENYIISVANEVTDEELNKFIILASTIKNYDVTNDINKIDKELLMVWDKTDKIFGLKPYNVMEKYKKENIHLYLYDGFGHALYDFAPEFKGLMFNFFMGKE